MLYIRFHSRSEKSKSSSIRHRIGSGRIAQTVTGPNVAVGEVVRPVGHGGSVGVVGDVQEGEAQPFVSVRQ